MGAAEGAHGSAHDGHPKPRATGLLSLGGSSASLILERSAVDPDWDCESLGRTSRGARETSAALAYASRIPRALAFHALNSLLGAAGFAFVLSGAALSIGLLALCCVGVLVFRALLLVTPLLVKVDVALHNFMAPPGRQLCERSAAQIDESLFLQRRIALMAVVYLSTVKMGTGVLSALVLALAFALPLNALSSASFRAEYLYAGSAAYTELAVTSLVFLAAGLALMPYVARLSCATTRYFCCEAFCSHTFYSAIDASGPAYASIRTYGTRDDDWR